MYCASGVSGVSSCRMAKRPLVISVTTESARLFRATTRYETLSVVRSSLGRVVRPAKKPAGISTFSKAGFRRAIASASLIAISSGADLPRHSAENVRQRVSQRRHDQNRLDQVFLDRRGDIARPQEDV